MKIVAGTSSYFAGIDLDPGEKHFLTTLFSDVAQLLTPEDDGDVDPFERLVGMVDVDRPVDPALLRLLPDADSEDPERSREFRRHTEFDLREQKLANLRIVLHSLESTGRIKLTQDQVLAWSKALTDTRLVLASRLEVTTEADFEELYAEEDTLDEQRSTMLTLYDFLTWAQERLTGVLMDALDDEEPAAGADDSSEDGGS